MEDLGSPDFVSSLLIDSFEFTVYVYIYIYLYQTKQASALKAQAPFDRQPDSQVDRKFLGCSISLEQLKFADPYVCLHLCSLYFILYSR